MMDTLKNQPSSILPGKVTTIRTSLPPISDRLVEAEFPFAWKPENYITFGEYATHIDFDRSARDLAHILLQPNEFLDYDGSPPHPLTRIERFRNWLGERVITLGYKIIGEDRPEDGVLFD